MSELEDKDRIKDKLIRDILGLEKELWIPMHQSQYDDFISKDLTYLTNYFNKLMVVKDNPV